MKASKRCTWLPCESLQMCHGYLSWLIKVPLKKTLVKRMWGPRHVRFDDEHYCYVISYSTALQPMSRLQKPSGHSIWSTAWEGNIEGLSICTQLHALEQVQCPSCRSVTARVCCTVYAICCAAFTESARAVTASTRPPVATSLPSEFRDVPAWNTCRHPKNVRLHSSVQNLCNPYFTVTAEVSLYHLSSHGAWIVLNQGLCASSPLHL